MADPKNPPAEPALHRSSLNAQLNWLRAGVLGANDGIVSIAALVVGVAAATDDQFTLLTSGLAGLAAGALSMAAGEYVSVSAQRDTQNASLEQERRELAAMPDDELAELAGHYVGQGLAPELARQVAEQLTAHDALTAHARAEFGMDPAEVVRPWQAAGASALAFVLGAVLPLLAILLPPPGLRIPLCLAAVLLALAVTGTIFARIGGAGRSRAALRTMAGGGIAMAVTYGVGSLVGLAAP
jgi:VIT1/CCC1 family predicted Fe2+/Mn2+ transporter